MYVVWAYTAKSEKRASVLRDSAEKFLKTFLLLPLLSLISCTKSPAPSVVDLTAVGQPTWSGFFDHTFTAPSTTYVLNGTCDPKSVLLQTSFDQVTWTDFPGACPASGTFTLSVTFGTAKNVYSRAKSRNTFTAVSHALVVLALPPTSPAFMQVNASQSDQDGQGIIAIQGAMGPSYSGEEPISNGLNKVHAYMPGIVYAP